jgi:hypothetical protein
MKTVQVFGWDFVSGVCTYVTKENLVLISFFGLMKPVDTAVCTGPPKIRA